MSINYTLKGYNRVRNKLRRLAARSPQLGDEAVRGFAQEGRKVLKATPYAPKRPGQTYKRTGLLANAWRVIRGAVGQYTIINSTDYGHFVVGPQQAWMHKGRWWQAHKILQKLTPKLVKNLTQIYMKEWGK